MGNKNNDRGTFIEARAQDLVKKLDSQFDLAIAIGVLHHLDDEEASELFRAAGMLLKPGGRLITSDPVSRAGQNPIARLVMSMDRGKSIRSQAGYRALAGDGFHIQSQLRSDFMRIPYDHCILVCEKISHDPRG